MVSFDGGAGASDVGPEMLQDLDYVKALAFGRCISHLGRGERAAGTNYDLLSVIP